MTAGTPSSSTPDGGRGLYGQRPSKSHDPIRRKQFERISQLSPLERMIAALELAEEAVETGSPGRRAHRGSGR